MTNENTPIDPLEEQSIFIDVSWNTEDERLENAVNSLLSDVLSITKTKRIDGASGWRRHLRATLIILIRTYQTDPNALIACPMSNNFGKQSYRPDYDPQNPQRYDFKKIQAIVKIFADFEFLKLHIGKRDFFSGEYKGLCTRIEMTEALHVFIQRFSLEGIEFEKVLINGGMIVKYRNKRDTKKIKYDYSDLGEPKSIKQSKKILTAYNNLIKRSDIKLERQPSEQIVNLNNKISFRTFSNNSYDYGGRFYGGWWTNCKRENRRYISINNQSTIESDYTANHLCFYYSLNGEEIADALKKDPYSISKVYPRSLIKLIINRLFNCDGRRGIVNHFRERLRFTNGEDEENLYLMRHYLSTAIEVNRVLDVIFASHPILRKQRNNQQGLILQNWDSKIAEQVLKLMTDLDIPCLCIHDSFIVSIEFEDELKEAMRTAYSFYPDASLNIPEIKDKKSKLTINDKGIIDIEE